jgi:hypothetical protein
MECEIILEGAIWPRDILDRTVKAMKAEHARYYGTPAGWRRGFGYQLYDMYHRWVTSGNNVLGIRLDPLGRIHIRVEGRRHGIPWGFLPLDVRKTMEKVFICDGEFHLRTNYGRVKWVKTMEPTLAPWQANNSDYPTEWGAIVAQE